MSSYQDRQLYHITHIRNLPRILATGQLLCDAEVARQSLVETDIGMPSIKARRRRTLVTCGAGGTPADYVPFYLGPRSPMLFSISRGRVPRYTEGQDPVVYAPVQAGLSRQLSCVPGSLPAR